jgi:hypothetical protein
MMNLQDYATILGIASIFISGAAVILTWIARAFWSLTYKKKADDDEKRFTALEIGHKELQGYEEQNKYFRHNFNAVTKGLEQHITSQIEHLREVMDLNFQILKKGNNDEKSR